MQSKSKATRYSNSAALYFRGGFELLCTARALYNSIALENAFYSHPKTSEIFLFALSLIFSDTPCVFFRFSNRAREARLTQEII